MDSDYQGSSLLQEFCKIYFQRLWSTSARILPSRTWTCNLPALLNLWCTCNQPGMHLWCACNHPWVHKGWANSIHFIVWSIASQFWRHFQGLQQLFLATVVFLYHQEYSSNALLEIDFLIEQKFAVPSPQLVIDWLLQLNVIHHHLL